MEPYYIVGFETIHQSTCESLEEAIKKAEEKSKEKLGTTFMVSRVVALVSTLAPTPSTFWLDGEGLDKEKKPSEKEFEHMDDTMPCPSHRPNGWRQVKEGLVERHDYVYWLEDGMGEWASDFIGTPIPEEDVAIYRQPNRF